MRTLAFTPILLLSLACGREPAAPEESDAASLRIERATGGYDVYVYDVGSGSVIQATGIVGAGEFNPSFAPSGRAIIHDVVTPSTHDLYITDLATHVGTPLTGGDGGNDADWSAAGLIAFDRAPAGDPSVYVVAASGGTRSRIRAHAVEPDWDPTGRRLVVVDVTDGSVRVVLLGSGNEHTVAPFGANPTWSSEGRRIAYSDGNNIYFVRVGDAGAAVGAPVQVTFDGPSVFNGQPSWSSDDQTIVFHSNRGNTVFDFDLWTVRITGGEPTRLTGTVGQGDFDPSYFLNRLVAFAGFTPAHP